MLKGFTFFLRGDRGHINWNVFSLGSLSRIDLCFDRITESIDDLSRKDFLLKCQEKINTTSKTYKAIKNQKGSRLNICKRKKDKVARIYERVCENSLKFEYERKNPYLKTLNYFFVSSKSEDLEEFEKILTEDFIFYFGKLLPLEYCYSDWLARKVRFFQKLQMSNKILPTDYSFHKSR